MILIRKMSLTLNEASIIQILIFSSILFHSAHSKCYIKETFDDGYDEHWIVSNWRKADNMAGSWKHTAGKWFGDEKINKGIQTYPDAKFHAISTELPETFDNKDSDLVIQFSVKHEQKLDCGGGYIKVIPESSKDKMREEFSGDTPYLIMFGPDICGTGTKKVHVLLGRNGKNYMIKKNIPCKTDQLTHLYTLHLLTNNTFKVYIDMELEKEGDLYKDFDILPPKMIKDPDAKKPEDWDDRRKIPDPDDVKPEGYDDIPEFIDDLEAEKPEDWNEEEDGIWEPPKIPNPEFKGLWQPKMMDNPNYKGKWEAPEIENPDYVHADNLYHHPNIKYLGFELWQVKSGSIFDNIALCDSIDDAFTFGKETWGATYEEEKKEFDKIEEIRKKEEEAEREKLMGDSSSMDDYEDEYEDVMENMEDLVDMNNLKEEL